MQEDAQRSKTKSSARRCFQFPKIASAKSRADASSDAREWGVKGSKFWSQKSPSASLWATDKAPKSKTDWYLRAKAWVRKWAGKGKLILVLEERGMEGEGAAHAALMSALKLSSLMTSDASNTFKGDEGGEGKARSSGGFAPMELRNGEGQGWNEGKEPKVLELLRKEPCLMKRSIKTIAIESHGSVDGGGKRKEKLVNCTRTLLPPHEMVVGGTPQGEAAKALTMSITAGVRARSAAERLVQSLQPTRWCCRMSWRRVCRQLRCSRGGSREKLSMETQG